MEIWTVFTLIQGMSNTLVCRVVLWLYTISRISNNVIMVVLFWRIYFNDFWVLHLFSYLRLRDPIVFILIIFRGLLLYVQISISFYVILHYRIRQRTHRQFIPRPFRSTHINSWNRGYSIVSLF